MDSSITILAFLFMGGASYASDLSLMLTPAEEKALDQAEERAQEKKDPVGGFRTLRLDGIIYIDPNRWTIWLNGRTLKAGDAMGAIQILEVTPTSVELIWHPKSGEQRRISLNPNEVIHETSP